MSLSPTVESDPVYGWPDESPIPSPHPPQYHHMDFLTTSQCIKQEPGTFDSPDTVVGHQTWQKSPELRVDVPSQEDQLKFSVKLEDQSISSFRLELHESGDEIQAEKIKFESTRSEDPSSLYICIPGNLKKGSAQCAEVQEKNSNSADPYGQSSAVPVALYRRKLKPAATAANENPEFENYQSTGEELKISSSPLISSFVTSESRVDHQGDERPACSLQTGKKSLQHKNMQAGGKPIGCTVCDQRFSTKSRLNRHMVSHFGEKPFKCTVCDHRSTNNRDLVMHMRAHTGEKPFKCKVCDYRSSNKSGLTVHMRTHTGEKPFKCSLCDYRCSNSSFTMHMRTHTGEKPFKCTECEYRSTNNRDLVVHMRSHSGEKPFRCTICDYRSNKNGDLVVHKRSHTEEKPFSAVSVTIIVLQNGA